MCGIIGFFDMQGKPDTPEAALRKGMAAMQERGPDDEGVFSLPGLLFGHKRLSIIDLQGGHQPFIDKQSGSVLIFNGEIYNFKELRSKLISLHHTFNTLSDSEVLLHAYLEWNTNCLPHLSGMFAFAIYDPRKKSIFIARDRLGIKPLFYSINKSEIMFASSCKALCCFPHVPATLDPVALSHYITTIRTTMGRRTLISGVCSLLPGEYMTASIGDSQPSITRYWDIPITASADKADKGIDMAANQSLELITNSVREQLISDVPLGGFLSGGLDSSILSSLATGMTSNNFNAYSVGYDRDGYNEWAYIREAADYYKMNCREIHLDENAFPGDWKKLIDIKGLPISTPNEIGIYHLAKALKEDYTVALSGEGADEVFGGYTIPYFSAYDFERARRSKPEHSEPLSAVDRAIQRFYKRPYLLCRPDHYFLTNSWLTFEQKQSLLSPGMWAALNNDSELFDHYEQYFQRLEKCSTMDAYMHIHARINLEGLLSRVDSSTMAASVEGRVPFTDHRIVEHLFSLPDNYKIDWIDATAKSKAHNMNIIEIDRKQLLESKILLRRAFAGKVPESIMKRPKVSFPMPFREWFAGPLAPMAKEIISSSPLIGTMFNKNYAQQLLATADQPQSAMILWPLTNLCLWQDQCSISLP